MEHITVGREVTITHKYPLGVTNYMAKVIEVRGRTITVEAYYMGQHMIHSFNRKTRTNKLGNVSFSV